MCPRRRAAESSNLKVRERRGSRSRWQALQQICQLVRMPLFHGEYFLQHVALSRPPQNEDDESDNEERSKYSTADVHVDLLEKVPR